MNKSESINELAAALSKAQGEMGSAPKTGVNPHFKSTFSTFEDVRNASMPALAKHGLSITQPTLMILDNLYVETVLMHSSGQWMSGVYPINPVKQDPQGFKSALTYAKRAGWEAIVGIASGDDDAEVAMDRKNENKAPANPASNDLDKALSKKPKNDMGSIKATSGIWVGKTFAEIKASDEYVGYQWTKKRYEELVDGKKLDDWAIKYMDYIEMCGVEL